MNKTFLFFCISIEFFALHFCEKVAFDVFKFFVCFKVCYSFENNKVFSRTELAARKEINEENYCKVINIEARTMIDMIRREILPAAAKYKVKLAETLNMGRSSLYRSLDALLRAHILTKNGNTYVIEKEG